MSRTYRKKVDKPHILEWIEECSWYSGYIKTKLANNKKFVKQEVAKHYSDNNDFNGYSSDKGPKWWNRLYHIKPKRQETRRLIHKTIRLIDYEDTPEFPLGNKKPHEYWW